MICMCDYALCDLLTPSILWAYGDHGHIYVYVSAAGY